MTQITWTVRESLVEKNGERKGYAHVRLDVIEGWEYLITSDREKARLTIWTHSHTFHIHGEEATVINQQLLNQEENPS